MSYLRRLAARSTTRPPVLGRPFAVMRSAVVDPFAAASEPADQATPEAAPSLPLQALARPNVGPLVGPLPEVSLHPRPLAPVFLSAPQRAVEEPGPAVGDVVPPALVAPPPVPVRPAPPPMSPRREVVAPRVRNVTVPAPVVSVVSERGTRAVVAPPVAAPPPPPRMISSPAIAVRSLKGAVKTAERPALRPPSPQIVIGRVSVTIEGPAPKIVEAPRRTIVVPSKQVSSGDDKLGLGLGQR